MAQNLKIKIEKLINDFKERNGWDRSEEDIQTSFTIKLLEILGWDSSHWVINTGQDVKTGKKPDIVLKSGSSKLLVIESKDAKKKEMLDGSYGNKKFTDQLFGYCKGEGVSWGFLTNFVEWRLYSVHHSRLYKEKKYAFHDILWPNANKNSYIDLLSDEGLKFLDLFSRQFLIRENGIIDKDPIYYPEQLDIELKKIKNEFFIKIKNWRANLKKYIGKNYANFNTEQVDLMAQKTLDRMIFMDICHDKRIIYENHLLAILSSKRPKYEELKEKFKTMNEKFNTELFTPNEIDEIKISDEIIIPIINELDEIDFSKLSVHIIGEVYENYLGELAKSNVKKEELIKQKQKSKRKSQGIYYTPDYIVDYIVKNTVGELLKKAKTEVDIEKIRVLDPACGSGSFLIRAFDEFYEAYKRVTKEGGLFGFDIKKKILQNNLFGVDLDPKAVEIAKLNLMIKALEDVSHQELKGKYLLPNLNLNIRCGNSLIGGEKLKEKEKNLNLFDDFDTEINKLTDLKNKFHQAPGNGEKKELLEEINKFEEYINEELNDGLYKYFKNLDKIKPFNYSVAFCEIFKDGGFDAVIGNPPYLSIERGLLNDKKFYKENYATIHKIYDIFGLFIEGLFEKLQQNKYLGFIMPNIILQNDSFSLLRKYILDNAKIMSIDNYQDGVFSDAVVPTVILVLQKNKSNSRHLVNVNIHEKDRDTESFKYKQLNFKSDKYFRFNTELDEKFLNIKKRVYLDSKPINEILKIQEAIKTGNDKEFITDSPNNLQTEHKLLKGTDIARYVIKNERYINYDIDLLSRPGKQEVFELPKKMYIRRVGNKIIAVLDDKQRYAVHTLYTGVLINDDFIYEYILALLNSKLYTYLYKKLYPFKGRIFPEIRIGNLGELPVKIVSKMIQKEFFKKVKEMQKLNKTPESREKNKTKIQALDYEIDKVVYELYGLEEGEIKVVEES